MLKPNIERRGPLQRLAALPLWAQVAVGVPVGLLSYRAIVALGAAFLGRLDQEWWDFNHCYIRASWCTYGTWPITLSVMALAAIAAAWGVVALWRRCGAR